jgi:hypothetical protein
VLQAGTPSTWLFKSPVHLARLGALFETYPDARIIRTHRDPVKTAASTVSTLAHGRYTRSDEVDPMAIASTSVIGLQMSLNAIAAPEAALPAGQVAEIQYVELMRDPPAAIAGVYDTLGLPMAPELPDLVSDYLDQRPKGRLGAHTYSVEDFGMDAGVIRKELAPYIEAFGVPSETSTSGAGRPPAVSSRRGWCARRRGPRRGGRPRRTTWSPIPRGAAAARWRR